MSVREEGTRRHAPQSPANRIDSYGDEPDVAGRDQHFGSPSTRATTRGGTSRPQSYRAGQAPSERMQPTRHVASLDGLRSLAILSVVFYHLDVFWLPSGHMGVVMFLVLTGYLVTNSVMRQINSSGGVDLRRLWGRRLARLWPAMAVMVVVVAALCVIFNHVMLTKLRGDALWSLTFLANWHYIFSGTSYFDQIGAPSPLTHLWYLGVDAQLVIVWPLVLLGLSKLGLSDGSDGSRPLLRWVTLGLAAISAILMAVLYDPNADPSRVYYGADTRAFSVLVGAWLAMAWPLGSAPRLGAGLLLTMVPARDGSGQVVRSSMAGSLMGVVALAVLVIIMVAVPENSAFFYRGGMLLVSLVVAALIASLLAPGSFLAGVFSLTPLVWLGERSYSLYLWHYPLLWLVGAVRGPLWLMVVGLALSLLAAELSFRYAEPLVSGGGAARLLESVRSRGIVDVVRDNPIVMGGCGAVLLVALVGGLVVPDKVLVPSDALRNTGSSAGRGMDASQLPSITRGEGGSMGTDATAAAPVQVQTVVPTGSITLHAGEYEKQNGLYDPVLIGDSVPGGGESYFYAHDVNGLIDTYVGRRPDQMEFVLNDYLQQGIVGHVVILQAFGNTLTTTDQIESMIAACGDREVYLVTGNLPTTDEAFGNNALIYAVANLHANAHVIDWFAYSSGHEGEWLYDDGQHLREDYYNVYFDYINNAIAQDFLEYGGTADADPNDSETAQAIAAEAEKVRQNAVALYSNPNRVYESADKVEQGLYEPLLVGDDVPGGADFYQVFPTGLSDCYAGRWPGQALDVYRDYEARGLVGGAVVFAGFSSGSISSDQLEELVAGVGEGHGVYLVGVVSPSEATASTNRLLRACADAHEGVTYVDWPGVCAGNEGAYLYEDGMHLTPEGSIAYLRAIASAVTVEMVNSGGSVA